jgi:ribosomal protein L20
VDHPPLSRLPHARHALQRAGVLLNRKMLSQLAIEDPRAFDQLVQVAEKNTAASAAAA